MNSRPPPALNGTGLCLSGGGITGAMYQVGCLAALEDYYEDFRSSHFDVFVGSASGATVAMGLAGGLSASRLYRALLDPADDFFPLQRQHLLRLDSQEWWRVLRSSVGAARHLLNSVSSRPLEVDVWNELERFTDSMPAGIFNLNAYERFLRDLARRRGIPASFHRMTRRLVIVGHDLDAGERVLFGVGEYAAVPVTRAVVASSAIPLLFAPVRIGDRDFVDGGLGEVGHADVAVNMGCDVVVVINPMVPVKPDLDLRTVPTGHGRRARIRDKGLLWVYNQSARLRSEARFQHGIEAFRQAHPQTRVIVLEPRADERVMFMYSPMNFAARRVILEEGYRSTMRELREGGSGLKDALGTKGLRPRSGPGAERRDGSETPSPATGS